MLPEHKRAARGKDVKYLKSPSEKGGRGISRALQSRDCAPPLTASFSYIQG